MTAQNSIAEKSFFGRYFLYKLRTNFNYLVFNLDLCISGYAGNGGMPYIYSRKSQ